MASINELKKRIEDFEQRAKDTNLPEIGRNKFKKLAEDAKDELKELEAKGKKVEKKVEKAAKNVAGDIKEDVNKLKDKIKDLEERAKDTNLPEIGRNKFKKLADEAKAELAKIETGAKKTVKKVEKKVEKVVAKAKEKWGIEVTRTTRYEDSEGHDQKGEVTDFILDLPSEDAAKKKANELHETDKTVDQTDIYSYTEEKGKKPIAKKSTTKKPAAKKTEPTVEVNGKTLTVEDCKEVIAEWNKKRKKAAESSKRSRNRSTSTRVAADVSGAVRTAIESTPAAEISANPTAEINKFKKLKEAAEGFLKAFKVVLGDDYNNVDINKELKDIQELIDGLISKYK